MVDTPQKKEKPAQDAGRNVAQSRNYTWDPRKAKKWREKGYQGPPPFEDYPLDKFFTRPLYSPIIIIPRGYAGVRLRGGTIGEIFSYIEDDHGLETDAVGNPIKVQRDFPWGGSQRPGIHLVVSLGGLLSKMAIVEMTLRSEDRKLENVVNKGGLNFPFVISTLHWRITDPVKTMTQAQNYKNTVYEVSDTLVRDTIVRSTLDDLEKVEKGKINLAYRINNIELNKIGVKIDGLYLTNIKFPPEAEPILAAEEFARARAEELKVISQAQLDAAENIRKAGEKYDSSPGAQGIFNAEAAKTGGGNIKYEPHLPAAAKIIADAIRDILSRRRP